MSILSNVCAQSVKKCLFLFKSSKQLTSLDLVRIKIADIRIHADHGRDFSPLADHMTKLKNFTKDENHDFSAFRFSLHLKLTRLLSPLAHRAETRVLHLFLSAPCSAAWPQLRCICSSAVFLQVFLGSPRFLLPSGVHLSAILNA